MPPWGLPPFLPQRLRPAPQRSAEHRLRLTPGFVRYALLRAVLHGRTWWQKLGHRLADTWHPGCTEGWNSKSLSLLEKGGLKRYKLPWHGRGFQEMTCGHKHNKCLLEQAWDNQAARPLQDSKRPVADSLCVVRGHIMKIAMGELLCNQSLRGGSWSMRWVRRGIGGGGRWKRKNIFVVIGLKKKKY